MSPYDLDTARIRLMYRIPKAPARGRALDLSVNEQSILQANNWAGDFTLFNVSASDCSKGLPFPDGSFDVVLMHRTLDQLWLLARRQGRTFVLRDVLSQVAGLLATGGLVMGCVENRHGLNRLLRSVKRLSGRSDQIAAYAASDFPLSVSACRKALAVAGFEDIRLFSVLPGPDSPRRLLSIDRSWSRRGCRWQVEEMRALMRPSRFIVWRVLAEIGVSQYVGAAILFWGRKGC